MFNTGARVQEILNLRVCDLRLDPPEQVRLHGKVGTADRSPDSACVTSYASTYRTIAPRLTVSAFTRTPCDTLPRFIY